MGADLYIDILYQPQREKWQKEFDKAVEERNSLEPETEAHRKAQTKVEHAFSRMYERGYFRDSYNDNNLLRKFGLSWWDDVIPMLNDGGDLSVGQAERLLEMLEDRHPVFGASLMPMPLARRKEFLDAYDDLKNFLNEAIALDQPIRVSL